MFALEMNTDSMVTCSNCPDNDDLRRGLRLPDVGKEGTLGLFPHIRNGAVWLASSIAVRKKGRKDGLSVRS